MGLSGYKANLEWDISYTALAGVANGSFPAFTNFVRVSLRMQSFRRLSNRKSNSCK